MKTLFDQTILGGIPVKNRIVRSATLEEGAAENGGFGPKIFDIYEKLAKGGVGTIVTGMVGIDQNSRNSFRMVDGRCDAFCRSLREMADMVHAQDARLVIQLAHCGRNARVMENNLPPMAPSRPEGKPYRELTKEDIHAIAEGFAAAALNCKEAGADGVQIHGAHGYLLSQFLSPDRNFRTDEYGGPIENRARAVFEVYDAIRAAVGPEYPIWIKINGGDHVPEGLSCEDALWVCKELDKRGIHAIEVSGGRTKTPVLPFQAKVFKEEDEANFLSEALAVGQLVSADVISVSAYRTPSVAEAALNRGERINAISFCRPLISEPDLPNRWKSGDLKKSRCVSCTKCATPGYYAVCLAFEKPEEA